MNNKYFEVYDIPYRSNRYFSIKKKIETELIKKYTFRENMICVNSVLCKEDCNDEIKNLIDKRYVKSINILENDNTFISDYNFKYVPRYMAEYDPGLYQIECCLLLYDEYGNILLLQKNKNTTDGLITMIQGHVEYSREIYTMNKSDFIKLNMIREIKEEVSNFPKISIDNLERSGYIYSNANLVKMIHIGVLYKYKISHKNMKNIISKEPNKHRVIIVSHEKLYSDEYKNKLDPWLQVLIDKNIN